MKVRLAFSVAAHLEPEVLIIDEVLAVGDAAFQKKCLGKMDDTTRAGRTVLFVSHNMAAIERLCQRVIFLQDGRIAAEGDPGEVIQHYLKDTYSAQESTVNLLKHDGRPFGMATILREVHILTNGVASTTMQMGGSLKVITTFHSDTPLRHMRFGIVIENNLGQRIIVFSPTLHAPTLLPDTISEGEITCDIPHLPLTPGSYYITLIVGTGTADVDRVNRALQFDVISADVFGTGYAPKNTHGVFYQNAEWSVSEC
jgi:lipopolysaccharide transport system ATP-binding protein